MTVRDILNRSLRLIGVLASGETASASMIQDAFVSMNAMIDSWKNVGLMVFENQVLSLTLISGQQTYTIGTGGQLNVDRPNAINQATFILNNIEYIVDILTESEWSQIPDKNTTSDIPTKLYFNPSFPLGQISFWPKPSSALSIKLYSPKPVNKFASVESTVDLPPGYEDLIVYGSADRIANEYGKELTPKHDAILNQTKAEIMRKNTTEEFMTCDVITSAQNGYGDIYSGGRR